MREASIRAGYARSAEKKEARGAARPNAARAGEGLGMIPSVAPYLCMGAADAAPKTGFLRAKPVGGGLGRRSLPTSPPNRLDIFLPSRYALD